MTDGVDAFHDGWVTIDLEAEVNSSASFSGTLYFQPQPVFPTPSPTPTPCNCRYENCSSSSQSGSAGVMFTLANLDRVANQAALLYRVRDELLSTTEEGQRYIDLYYSHSAEIATIMVTHSELDDQGLDVIDTLTPNLQALLDRQGSSITITNEQVQQAQAFLDALLPYASSGLQQAIANERARRPLEQFIGMSMDQAWAEINVAATATPTNSPTNTPTSTPTSTSTPTPTATPTQPIQPLYLSLNNAATVGGISAQDIDIVYFNGTAWNMFFDGSDVGINTSSQDINEFHLLDSDTILMIFDEPVTLGTLAVDPWDVVRFDATSLGDNTAGTFSMYLDGDDVGLDTTAEYLDGLDVLPDGHVLISTTGSPTVSGVTGAADEDILAFTPTALGDVTSGTWSMYFDGSDVGLADSSNEDVDAAAVHFNGDIYLSTLGDFAVTGVSGFDEDVFICTPTSLGSVTACDYATSLYFDGSTYGLDANDVDGIDLTLP